ncbi:EamA family transporter [Ornithinimicrobium faecis]|uniref:EamA family transporter n=1 Tax=Ornithinimicrobium faecis TaxID=2934158 RepID=A0ABY4YXV8_9MICO|nr:MULTISPECIES: EamA family transporter [unclassified Ornithinimicrobium]USQ80937.1 EamA family transporter [Ornithinimicrobium sp. HY1793]
MPIRHRLLAVSVAIMWGLNFTAIHASLEHFPPFFLVALRFLVLAVPTIFLVPWPRVPVRWLVGYGLGFGTLQFLFLYWGMSAGMPAGLASLVLQASAPFTVVLGALFLRERLTGLQVVGILIAVGGLALVGAHRAQLAAVLPFLLTLAGALGWAIGNICNRQARPRNPLHLALWVSVVPPLPMLAVSLVVEGPSRIGTSLSTAFTPQALPAMVGLAYTVVIGTVVGTGIWTWLMAHHPAGVVAPYSLLVPVAGMLSAWLVLGETVRGPEILGGVIVVAGVLLGSLRRRPRANTSTPAAVSPEPLPEPVPVTSGPHQPSGAGPTW